MKLARPLSARRRARSRGAIRPSLLVVAAVVFLPMVFIGARKSVQDRARSQEIVDALNEYQRANQQAYRSTESGTEYTNQSRALLAQTVTKLERIATGDTPMDILARMIAAHARENEPLEARYAELIAALEQGPGADITAARSPIEIDRRIAVLNELEELTGQFGQRMETLPGKLRRGLEDGGLQRREVEKTVGEFARGMAGAPQVRVLALEKEIIGYMRDQAVMLKGSWGRWRLVNDELIFDEDRDADAYNLIWEKLDRAITEQERIMLGS